MISITALVLGISIGFLVPKAVAQSDKYSKMANVASTISLFLPRRSAWKSCATCTAIRFSGV